VRVASAELRAISRAATVIIIIVIILGAGAGVYYYATLNGSPTTSSTPSSSTLTSSSSTPTTSTTSIGTTSSSSAGGGTLSIDDYVWPTGGLNELYAISFLPYPDWQEGSVYQTLVAVNLTAEQQLGKFSGVFLPGLASAWNSSADGMTYTFTLRQGITFSDGNTFNSYAVWSEFFTWYYLSGDVPTFWNALNIFNTAGVTFNNVKFGQMVNASGLSNPSAALISWMSNKSLPAYVTGPYTINFHLSTPFPFFINTFTGFQGMIFDPTYMYHHGGPGAPGVFNPAFNLIPIPGTGPYVVTNAVFQSSVSFTQNPNYWGKSLTTAEIARNPILDPGHYKNVIIYDIPSSTTSLLNLQNNVAQISAVTSSSFQLVNSQPNAYGVAVIKHPATLVWMFMNNKRFPTNITGVRQAIVHAINYTNVIQAGALGYGTRMLGPEVPFYGQFYNPGNLAPYLTDYTLAAQDLANAGYPNGKGLPAMTLYVDVLGEFYESPMAQEIQADLAKIGLTINIQVVTDAQYYQYYGSYQTNVGNAANIPNLAMGNVAGFSPDYLAPTDFWGAFVTTYSLWGNFGMYNNTAVDNDVAFMSHSSDTTAIVQHLMDAESHIYADAPYAWLFDAELPAIQGSFVYKLNTISSSFFMEPNLMGVSDVPLFNTVTPA
jgi:ABC-type transport system substrate-binding protein